jgi:hypothetical protein
VLAGLEGAPHAIFLLRKPSERLLSSFRYSQQNIGALRPDVSFQDFVGLSSARSIDLSRYAVSGRERSLEIWRNDLAYGQYVDWLDRWTSVFPRERTHVFLFEDLRADPLGLVTRLCERIGLDPSPFLGFDFVARNRSLAGRNPFLHRLAVAVNSRLRGFPLRRSLRRLYVATLVKPGPEAPDAAEQGTLRQLDEHYRPFNRRLAAAWDLDLTTWE